MTRKLINGLKSLAVALLVVAPMCAYTWYEHVQQPTVPEYEWNRVELNCVLDVWSGELPTRRGRGPASAISDWLDEQQRAQHACFESHDRIH